MRVCSLPSATGRSTLRPPRRRWSRSLLLYVLTPSRQGESQSIRKEHQTHTRAWVCCLKSSLGVWALQRRSWRIGGRAPAEEWLQVLRHQALQGAAVLRASKEEGVHHDGTSVRHGRGPHCEGVPQSRRRHEMWVRTQKMARESGTAALARAWRGREQLSQRGVNRWRIGRPCAGTLALAVSRRPLRWRARCYGRVPPCIVTGLLTQVRLAKSSV